MLLMASVGTRDDSALTGREFTLMEKARHKAQCSQIIELVHRSVETLMFISGSSAFALDKPISRFWRDIHVGLRHIQNIRSEEHTSELQSLMRTSYAVFCLKKKKKPKYHTQIN